MISAASSPAVLDNKITTSRDVRVELLLNFGRQGSIRELSDYMKRDQSVISRQLKRVSERAPVLEKIKNQWRLTELGRQINHWSAEGIDSQKALLSAPMIIRMGASRMFGTKVIAPQIESLKKDQPETELQLICFDEGAEAALLNGSVDIAFSCGKPRDPQISFNRIIPERYVAVGSPHVRPSKSVDSLHKLRLDAHLLFRNQKGEHPFLALLHPLQKIGFTFNDPLCILEALLHGKSWTILPYFCVKDKIERGQLRLLCEVKSESTLYGIWWLRSRASLKPWVQNASEWLRQQKLA